MLTVEPALQSPCVTGYQQNFLGARPENIIGFQDLKQCVRKGSSLNA